MSTRVWPWTRWQERHRHAQGPYRDLFVPHQGRDWVALDLETTGLDTRQDEILSMAAIPGEGNRLRWRERLDLIVRSDSPRILDAIRHHRLRPADVAHGVPLDIALKQLLALIGNRPLVGYCIAFDIAILDRLLRPRLGFGLPNRRIDVRAEFATWQQLRQPEREPDLRYEAMTEALGIPVLARHTASGDALTAGLMHIRMATPSCGALIKR